MASNKHVVLKEGKLNKRQRGRSARGPWFGRSGLKFQERYFVLTSEKLIYKSKKDGSDKDHYPVKRIDIVEAVSDKVFDKPHVFQVGDDDEIMYLMAPSEEERLAWISAIQLAALKNGNVMSNAFHEGVFSDKKWSCCGGSSRSCDGCIPTNRYGKMESPKSKRILLADELHKKAMMSRQRDMVQSMIEPIRATIRISQDRRHSMDSKEPTLDREPVDEGHTQLVEEKEQIDNKEDIKRTSSSSDDSGRGSSIPPSSGTPLEDVSSTNQPSSLVQDNLSSQIKNGESPILSSVPLANASPKSPEKDKKASPKGSDKKASPKGSPHQEEKSSPKVSPQEDKKSLLKASPEQDKISSPKGSPKQEKKSSPKGSPKQEKKSSPKGSPKQEMKSSPKGSPKQEKKSSPKGSPKQEKKSPKASPKDNKKALLKLAIETNNEIGQEGLLEVERTHTDSLLVNGEASNANALVVPGNALTPVSKRTSKAFLTPTRESPLKNGYYPLHMAIRDGNIELVNKELDLGADLEMPTATEPPMRPLYVAFSSDHYQVMEVLLTRGADPNGLSPRDNSTLLHAAAGKGNTKAVHLLIKFNSDMNIKNSKGDTPLHVAARHGHRSVVEILLKNNCKVNETNASCRNPLHEAAESGAVGIAQLLLDAGTDPLVRETCYDATPYILAHKAKKHEVCDLLRSRLPNSQQPFTHVTTQDSAHFASVEYIVFLNDKTLASAGGDTQVALWTLVDEDLVSQVTIPTGETILGLSHHKGVVVIGSIDVHVFAVDNPNTQRKMYLEMGEGKEPPLLVVGFTPSGQLAVAGTDDHSNEVKLLPELTSMEDLPSRPSSSFHVGSNPCCIYSLAVSPVTDNPIMAISVQPGTLFKPNGNKLVHFINYSSGQHLRTIDIGKGGVKVPLSMSFSPDGSTLAVACVDVVSIWCVENGELQRTLVPEDSSSVHTVCYSPNAPQILIGCQDGRVKVYSTNEWTLLFELHCQQGNITCAGFSVDGRLLATGCEDGSIALWKTDT